MDHVQLVLNLDDTLCVDVYRDNTGLEDVEQTVNTINFAADEAGVELRNYPFRLGKCENCGHNIITNRYSFDSIKCQNCGETNVVIQTETDDAREFVRSVNEGLGRKYTLITAENVNALILIPKLPKEETAMVLGILELYGFEPDSIEKPVYKALRKTADILGEDKFSRNLIAAQSKVQSGEELYNGIFPRIIECKRFLKKLNPKIGFVSAVED